MSPPQKKKTNVKKRDGSARSKQEKQSSSTPQTNEPPPTPNDEQTASYSTPVIRTSVMDEEKAQLELDFAVQNHQELLINKCLNDNRQERDKDQNHSCETVVRAAISKLQVQIKEEGDLPKVPLMLNEYENIVADAMKKIEVCDTYTDVLQQDYTTIIEYITQKMEKINRVNAKTYEIMQKSIDEQIIFDRESRLARERLEKLNREIEIASKKHDEMAKNVSDANKTIIHMTTAHSKLKKTSRRLKRQVDKKKREKQKSDEAAAAINDNVKKSINDKKETIKKLDEEGIQLKAKQAILLANLNNAKKKYNDLCQEGDRLTKKTADQEKDIARVNAANKNLLEDKTAKLEFQRKYSQLSNKLTKITHENAKMKNSVDEKQQQWDNLKRIKKTLLNKQRNYKEIQMKVAILKKENAETSTKLSITKKNVNDLKLREDESRMEALAFAKRFRYSTTNTTTDPDGMDATSDKSSINLIDLEGSDSDFDFNSFVSGV